jgi:hypothetical protein
MPRLRRDCIFWPRLSTGRPSTQSRSGSSAWVRSRGGPDSGRRSAAAITPTRTTRHNFARSLRGRCRGAAKRQGVARRPANSGPAQTTTAHHTRDPRSYGGRR